LRYVLEASLSNEVNNKWFDDYVDEADDLQVGEYDITSTPNDFNVLTLNSFIESGAVRIPGFQRNYVWDHGRASKLIESLILGLPIPQLFLYEQARNKFLVIDGQQRLMSIYYFVKKRFPRKDKRVALRAIFDQEGRMPDNVLHDDLYFDDFKLRLPEKIPDRKNRFNGLNYATLGDYKTQFDLRPLRNIIVKQNIPTDDDSSMYEVFNRLNTGGINLRPQEIRTSMYHSKFFEALNRINGMSEWRALIQNSEPDIHMKDMEVLLRGFAMLVDGANYAPSMVTFLNRFSRKCEANSDEQNQYLQGLFESFLGACSSLTPSAFLNKGNNRFNIALFEAVFTATCRAAFAQRRVLSGKISGESIAELSGDPEFIGAALQSTTRTTNVHKRLEVARVLISPL
jgi:uncharacterized protein with ParB-like and HNH nuclease domain